MRNKRWYILALSLSLLFSFFRLQAQDTSYARWVIDTLTADYFAGRGYLDDGDKKAADFIKSEFQKIKLKAFPQGYTQSFGFTVNTFPYDVSIQWDDSVFVPGRDFIISPACPNIHGTYQLIWLDSATIDSKYKYKKLLKSKLRRRFVVLNGVHKLKLKHPERLEKLLTYEVKTAGLIYDREKKLSWGVSPKIGKVAKIYFKEGTITKRIKQLTFSIDSRIKPHMTQNVIGYVEGSKQPDSFIVFTAHYDHLGKMGEEAVFPGANDNASGVAMLLDLANYYSQPKNRPAYSIAFMAFAAEEAGLLGSYYYKEHPYFPLYQIKFLLNIDLMGTGDKGAVVVNGKIHVDDYEQLTAINSLHKYLPQIKARGKVANSDHYYFSLAGVPAFFLYLTSNYYTAYHDIYDVSKPLKLDRYIGCFKLLTEFTKLKMR